MGTPPSLVTFNSLSFFIFDAPTSERLPAYIPEFHKHNIKHIVRACEPTYDAELLKREDITVHDLPFEDGGAPTADVLEKWLNLLAEFYPDDKDSQTIGVHCVAGLGRAPVLVAVALIEDGMPYLDAVTFLRKKRKGAINSKQLEFLKNYKPRGKKKCILQ